MTEESTTQPLTVVNRVRCKFVCNSILKYQGYGDGERKFFYEYTFSAVTSGSPENKQFYASTPSGTLKVSGVRDDLFEPGKEYYLDFTPAQE